MALDDPVTARIIAFIEEIGIPVIEEPVPEDSFLPGLRIRGGALLYDPATLDWPGDLLHEAGHIAVTDPAVRETLAEVSDSPGEEMAAIAWSYAAALEIGIDPALVFHEHGYRDAGPNILENFRKGSFFGVSLLDYYGLTAEAKWAETRGIPAYPVMTRWLR